MNNYHHPERYLIPDDADDDEPDEEPDDESDDGECQ